MKVLIITYYWPPSGGGGVQRWLKFATNLDNLGSTPVVFTPSNPDVPIIDASLESEVPTNIEVLKTPIFEPSRVLAKFSKKSASGRIGASGKDNPSKPSLLGSLSLWVRGNMFIPDARVKWVKPSISYLTKWISENPVDAIITTGPPHSMHLIGLGLKKKFKDMQWVADFRDPWSDMDYLSEFKISKRSMNKLVQMEKEVATSADKIMVTSKGASRKLSINKDCHVIPNGWDPQDFPKSLPQSVTSPTIKIGHFGSLHGSRNAPGFWHAIKTLREEGQQYELIFAGNVSGNIKSELNELGLLDICTFEGELEHKQSILSMLQCDALLLVHNDTDSATRSTPGKLFEYIATSKPIISICRSTGDLAERLSGWGLPFAEHKNSTSSKEMLLNLSDQPKVDPAPFTRMKLTENLLEILKK